jgi:hypothetical protein
MFLPVKPGIFRYEAALGPAAPQPVLRRTITQF